MDINALPTSSGLTVEKWSELLREQGVLFYDSKTGETPTITPEDKSIKMYDVADEKMMKELEGLLEGEELKESEVELTNVNPPLGYSAGTGITTTVNEDLTEGAWTTITTNNTTSEVVTLEDLAQSEVLLNIEELRNSLRQEVTPLTDNEVEQLEVQDPRGGLDTLPAGLTEEESLRIDAIMSAQNQIGPGFNLTDDE